jgi:hypothetical protein
MRDVVVNRPISHGRFAKRLVLTVWVGIGRGHREYMTMCRKGSGVYAQRLRRTDSALHVEMMNEWVLKTRRGLVGWISRKKR